MTTGLGKILNLAERKPLTPFSPGDLGENSRKEHVESRESNQDLINKINHRLGSEWRNITIISKKIKEKNLAKRILKFISVDNRNLSLEYGKGMCTIPLAGAAEGVYEIRIGSGINNDNTLLYQNPLVLEAYKTHPIDEEKKLTQLRQGGCWSIDSL